MSKVKVTKEGLFRTIKEVVKESGVANATTTGGANFTAGTGEQYATPKAFKKKVKESNTSAPFEKKFKHGTHPDAKVMDYKELWEEVPYTDFNHDRSALKSAFVDLYHNKVSDANVVGDAYDALFEKDPAVLAKLDAAREVIEKNATANKNYYLRAIDNIKAYLTQNLQESYSKFKTETKTRSKPEQFHQAMKGIKKKVHEINKLFEYSSQLKSELSEGEDQFKYGQRTEALIGKLQNSLREAFRKVSKFTNENQVEEVLTQDDYQKAMEILKQIEDKSPKIYRAILDMVVDIYPHSHREIEDLLKQSQVSLNEKETK